MVGCVEEVAEVCRNGPAKEDGEELEGDDCGICTPPPVVGFGVFLPEAGGG